MNSPVLFEELDTADGRKVGLATLNSPQTLNGLSLDMCKLLAARLRQWEDNAQIAMVVLRGAGDRAFCAGGDLHGIYKGMQDNSSGQAWDNVYAREFFDVEYRLDYHIHTYSKPLLCWGNGIVMGGGVGLMMGASHRVVTTSTRFAMPEISIGLFPDVGGTWMLSRLPGGIGLFLALTGAQLGANDCKLLGLADYTLDAEGWDALLAAIQGSSWRGDRQQDDVALRNLLLGLQVDESGQTGPLQNHYQAIRQACDGADFNGICANIAAWQQSEDPWLKRAASTFLAGSPGSARLSFSLLRRVHLMSLAEVFRQEYIVSLQCGVQGDLQEGIRALLIDKDKQPKWSPAVLDEATDAWVQRFFVSPWPADLAHPLADLGRQASA
ncbi:enoyl-CoA hydratase/isomerase family protein [Pollutimonas harenae]|uniref:3-hydroxyisobutyryl-CoA hydrolase n=1 Tax=Pollutimonas harenae TaxID=657015 RepID=A0A853H6B0_9BURK|nr:enoyl-CoA hydratase/isomerase family protein [Pollutimonas harenae]NYT86053.1 enoyl-CoA hydratase/isomerase family protein [Pollutimonas harenae]TEA71101.1 enoyl-CoA hydratase/isomerase family protein [Pollutimonas harenae]